MKADLTDKNTFWLLFELALRFKPELAEAAVRHNLTVQQLHVLGFLSDQMPHPMSWMAAFLGCDASNVTGIVDRMLTLNLVKRTESEKDRRVKMIQITPEGEVIRSTIMRELSEASQDCIAKILSEEEQAVFAKIMHKLLEASESSVCS